MLFRSLLEHALADPHGLGGDADAAAVEGLHGDLEALTLLSEALALGTGGRFYIILNLSIRDHKEL